MESKAPNLECYTPTFKPWLEHNEEFAKYVAVTAGRTLIGIDRLWYLYTLAKQAVNISGSWYECGVYKGGSAAMLAKILTDFAPDKKLLLFDTFEGMPPTDSTVDSHIKGDFADTSFESVKAFIEMAADLDGICYCGGCIPESFVWVCDDERESSFAHVDVDIYDSVKACTEFIYPLLAAGGIIIYDDYGFSQCYGARKAVDEFFKDKPEYPIILQSGQAIVIAQDDCDEDYDCDKAIK